jgi:beta-lactamase class A
MGSKTSVNPERSKKYGLGSTTAKEMIVLLEKVYHNKIATPAMCKEMIDHMKAAQDKDCFPRFLPAGVVVAHKTGAVTGVRTDAGILYLKKGGAVALCVLTSGNDDKRWASDNAGNVLCARVAQEVARYFAARAQAAGGKGKP